MSEDALTLTEGENTTILYIEHSIKNSKPIKNNGPKFKSHKPKPGSVRCPLCFETFKNLENHKKCRGHPSDFVAHKYVNFREVDFD